MNHTLRQVLTFAARQTLGRMPRLRPSRVGRPAILGGGSVRDVRIRPWPGSYRNSWLAWWGGAGAAFRRVFLTGAEGLPQTLQKEFANRWARYCACRFGLFLPHGTDALRLALAAALDHDGLEYGGEVIVPNLSFIATATAPLDRRLGVAFVDVEPDTLNLDPVQVAEAIRPGKTRAIVAVHQFGQPADMTRLASIARRHGLRLIEDAAQAHGAIWETGPVGSLGDAAAFSFQSSKNLNCGEGGILTTNDSDIYERAYSLHNAGRTRGRETRWQHEELGWNCRPTEYQASLLLHRFRRFDEEQQKRASNFAYLIRELSSLGCLQPLRVDSRVKRHGCYMLVLRYRAEYCGGLDIDRFLAAVQREGAPIYRCYTCTLSQQPAMRKLQERRPKYIRTLPTPVADQAVQEIVYIPGTALLAAKRDIEDIIAAVSKVASWFSANRSDAQLVQIS